MAFDLALRTGFAVGPADAKPRVETWILKRRDDPVDTAVRNLACTLRDNIQVEAPDLIAVEDFLHPAFQRNAESVILQLRMHGAIDAMAGVFGVRVVRPRADEIRVHFCGQASASPRTRGPKTEKQKAEARAKTKQMVLNRAIMLGYLPRDCQDDNKADACALFDFAAATFCRVQRPFAMFGQEARAQ